MFRIIIKACLMIKNPDYNPDKNDESIKKYIKAEYPETDEWLYIDSIYLNKERKRVSFLHGGFEYVSETIKGNIDSIEKSITDTFEESSFYDSRSGLKFKKYRCY